MSDNFQKNFLTQILDEFKSGDKSKAFKKLERHLKDSPDDNVSRFNFAIMCNETNKVDLAIKRTGFTATAQSCANRSATFEGMP